MDNLYTETALYKQRVAKKIDSLIHTIYTVSKSFPRDELYGATSQLRRSSLSIALNYIEGYARRRPAVQLNFLEISYGSLKETKYLLYFAKYELWISEKEYSTIITQAEELSKIIWTEIVNLEKSIRG